MSGTARVVNTVTNSLLPDFRSTQHPSRPTVEQPTVNGPTKSDRVTVNKSALERPAVDRLERPERLGRTDRSHTVAMATRLPASKYLKTDSVTVFDGSPEKSDAFDFSIRSMLVLYNFLLYYVGTMVGEPDGEYKYVCAADADGMSNYVLWKRLCAGLFGRLEKAALHWWHNYVCDNKSMPNFWRKRADCIHKVRGSVPTSVTEVSLYDLLHEHISSDMDAQKAELELESFIWKLFHKDSMCHG